MSHQHPNSPEQALLIDELRGTLQSELLDAVQRAEWLLKQSEFDGARQRAEAVLDTAHRLCAVA
jgi:hypothetical protein